MKPKIAVIGADGQLGTELSAIIPKDNLVPLTVKEIDISDYNSVARVFEKAKVGIIINTAAYHRVDECEENDIDAYLINAHGAKNLAQVSSRIGAVLLHLSTDYIFSGDKGSAYTEEDAPGPQTAYGISKYAGEQYIRYMNPRHFIIRTSGLYGKAGCLGKGGGNFVENIISKAQHKKEIKVVTDEVIGPTYAKDLSEKILGLISTDKFGTYHMTNAGQCSWWEFARAIVRNMGLNVEIKKITASELKTKAHRPKYSVLQNNNLNKIGLKGLRPWEEALKAYLVEMGYQKPATERRGF